jgi:hypothetical protein
MFFTFVLFFEVTKTYDKQCHMKSVKTCIAVLTQLKLYVIYNVLALYLACKLYNQNITARHSEVRSGESNVYVCYLAQKCIKKRT